MKILIPGWWGSRVFFPRCCSFKGTCSCPLRHPLQLFKQAWKIAAAQPQIPSKPKLIQRGPLPFTASDLRDPLSRTLAGGIIYRSRSWLPRYRDGPSRAHLPRLMFPRGAIQASSNVPLPPPLPPYILLCSNDYVPLFPASLSKMCLQKSWREDGLELCVRGNLTLWEAGWLRKESALAELGRQKRAVERGHLDGEAGCLPGRLSPPLRKLLSEEQSIPFSGSSAPCEISCRLFSRMCFVGFFSLILSLSLPSFLNLLLQMFAQAQDLLLKSPSALSLYSLPAVEVCLPPLDLQMRKCWEGTGSPSRPVLQRGVGAPCQDQVLYEPRALQRALG